MKQKSYCRYVCSFLIIFLSAGTVVSKLQVFGSESNASQKQSKHRSLQAFGFESSAPQKKIEHESLQVFGSESNAPQKQSRHESLQVFGFENTTVNRDAEFKRNSEESKFLYECMSVQARTMPLSAGVEYLFKKYKEAARPTLQVFSFVQQGQPIPPVSSLVGSSIDYLDTKSFEAFQEYLVGQDSYLSLLDQMWSLYGTRSKELIANGDTAGGQTIITQAFSKSSFALMLYQQVAAYAITFIQLRFAIFSLTTFSESGAKYFLKTELPALDTMMNTMQKSFDTHFSGQADGFPSVKSLKGVDAQALSDNYSSIYTSYAEQRASMCAQFSLSLATSLAKVYSPSLALSQPITTVCGYTFDALDLAGMLSCLDQFYMLGQTALTLFDKQTPPQSFGIYANPTQALQALYGSMALFYLYVAFVGQNRVTALAQSDAAVVYQNQMIGTQGASQKHSSFYANIIQALGFLQSNYQKATGYYELQMNVESSSIYSQIGSYLSSGAVSWNNAEVCMAKNDFSAAIAAYQVAANYFKSAGNNALSALLMHRTDAVTLSYYQLLLQSYAHYYQLDPSLNISMLVKQMTTPVSGTVTAEQARSWHTDYPHGFVQLFYYDAVQNTSGATPTSQGIAWLAGQAVPIFSHMLNAYQTDTSPTGSVIKQYLQNALVVLENSVEAAQSMFYNNALAQTKSLQKTGVAPKNVAADANLGSGTVYGVVEGSLQYIKIYEQYKKVDAVLAQPITTAGSMNGALQLPFQGFFNGTSISGFAPFSLLTQIYWSQMNVDPCLALAQQYPDYAQTLVSAALVLAYQAQALCTDSSLAGVLSNNYTATLSDKITMLLHNQYGSNTGLSLLMAEGNVLRDKAQSALDYESALACFAIAGLAGNTSAQTSYFETVDAYARWYQSTSKVDYAAFYAAAVYYRGYLAQQKGWTSSFDSKKQISAQLQTFTKQITGDLQAFSGLVAAKSYDKAIEQIQKLVTLQDEIYFMAARQKRDQLLFNVVGATDFIALSQTIAFPDGALKMQVPALAQSCKQTIISPLFPIELLYKCPEYVDPLANLAQLYLGQGMALLDGLKTEFFAGNYDVSLQDTYDKMTKSFTQAIDFFGKSNHSEMIVKVQQALTDGTAFTYYSLVIPSNTITDLLKKYTASEPSFSEQFKITQMQGKGAAALQQARKLQVFGFIEPKSPVKPKKEVLQVFGFIKKVQAALKIHTTKMSNPVKLSPAPVVKAIESSQSVTKPVVKNSAFSSAQAPQYLLRYAEQDLTALAQTEKQIAAALKQAPQGSVVKTTPALTYQDFLTQATATLGSKKIIKSSSSDTSLVTNLAVPLYRKFLTVNGYISDFSTVDQEVDRYSNQLMQLVTQGIECGNAHLFTSYSLEKKKQSDGTEHIVLVTNNGPMEAVPRFQGEYQTALLYYMEYGRFYAYSPQTVNVGGTLFTQLPDQDFSHQAQAFKGVMGAYFGQMDAYHQIIENSMEQAPSETATLAQKKTYSFDTYRQLYKKIASAYSWLFSALGGIQTVQKEQGIFWMSSASFNSLNFEKYGEYMNNNARFLVGYPSSASYKKVLDDISTLSSMATSYAQGASDQATLLKVLGALYEESGNLMFLYSQPAPTVDGYPSIQPTNLPIKGSLDFAQSYSTCSLPLQGSPQTPTSFVLPWGNFFASSDFYLQAYTQYQSAYAADPVASGTVFASDADYRRAWGKYISFLIHATVQRMALFGRNAIEADIQKTATGETFTLVDNSYFKTVLAQGQTYGGFSAQKNFGALGGGILISDNSATIQDQYAIMKSLLLDAFIYCLGAEKETQNQAATVTKAVSDASSTMLGGLLKCGFTYYIPGLQVAAQQSKGGSDVLTPVAALVNKNVGLDKLGTFNTKQLVYSNTFPALMEYCLTSLMGSENDPEGPFSKLTNPENMFALSNLTGQLYGMILILYSESFLPASDQNDPEKMGIDIQAAIQAQQQTMVVNSESYVG